MSEIGAGGDLVCWVHLPLSFSINGVEDWLPGGPRFLSSESAGSGHQR